MVMHDVVHRPRSETVRAIEIRSLETSNLNASGCQAIERVNTRGKLGQHVLLLPYIKELVLIPLVHRLSTRLALPPIIAFAHQGLQRSRHEAPPDF